MIEKGEVQAKGDDAQVERRLAGAATREAGVADGEAAATSEATAAPAAVATSEAIGSPEYATPSSEIDRATKPPAVQAVAPASLQQASTVSTRSFESFLSDFRSRFPAVYRKILLQITVPAPPVRVEDVGMGTGPQQPGDVKQAQEQRLEQLLKSMQIGTLKRSDLLYDVGYQANEMYIIISGSVTIYRDVAADPRDVVVKLGPCQCFGEYSMVWDDCDVSCRAKWGETHPIWQDAIYL